jgi:site-specific recombinase XerD
LIVFPFPFQELQKIFGVFQSVDVKKKIGFRDYTLLHLLYDSGARASEKTTLNLVGALPAAGSTSRRPNPDFGHREKDFFDQ